MEETAKRDAVPLVIRSGAEGWVQGEDWTFGKIIQACNQDQRCRPCEEFLKKVWLRVRVPLRRLS